jgi:hypothetical protein
VISFSDEMCFVVHFKGIPRRKSFLTMETSERAASRVIIDVFLESHFAPEPPGTVRTHHGLGQMMTFMLTKLAC